MAALICEDAHTARYAGFHPDVLSVAHPQECMSGLRLCFVCWPTPLHWTYTSISNLIVEAGGPSWGDCAASGSMCQMVVAMASSAALLLNPVPCCSQAVHCHLCGWWHPQLHPEGRQPSRKQDSSGAQGRHSAGSCTQCCSHLCEYNWLQQSD